MIALTGTDAIQIGFTVKKRLRDYIAAQLTNEADVVLIQQLTDDEDHPVGSPTVAIRTTDRERKRDTFNGVEGWLHEFQIEIRVAASPDSGGRMTEANEAPVSEAISDEVDHVLTRDGAREALEALGINNLWLGKRTESSAKEIHINRHPVTFEVAAIP